MVAGILKKVISPFIQPHARRGFPNVNGSWHFEKGHFTVLSALRARDFPEQKWSLAF